MQTFNIEQGKALLVLSSLLLLLVFSVSVSAFFVLVLLFFVFVFVLTLIRRRGSLAFPALFLVFLFPLLLLFTFLLFHLQKLLKLLYPEGEC